MARESHGGSGHDTRDGYSSDTGYDDRGSLPPTNKPAESVMRGENRRAENRESVEEDGHRLVGSHGQKEEEEVLGGEEGVKRMENAQVKAADAFLSRLARGGKNGGATDAIVAALVGGKVPAREDRRQSVSLGDSAQRKVGPQLGGTKPHGVKEARDLRSVTAKRRDGDLPPKGHRAPNQRKKKS